MEKVQIETLAEEASANIIEHVVRNIYGVNSETMFALINKEILHVALESQAITKEEDAKKFLSIRPLDSCI